MKKNPSKQIVILSAVIMSLCLSGYAKNPNTSVLASVEGENITLTDLQDRIKAFPPQYASELEKKETKAKILDQMIDEKILLVAAKKQGLNKTDEFKKRVQNAQDQLLLNAYVQTSIEISPVSDEEVKAYFTNNPQQFQELETRSAHHILVKTEDEAKEITQKIKAGADFEKLAKEKSTDPSAASNFGNLGSISKGQMVPEFEKAVFSAKKGDAPSIVKTQFGYHVVRLDDINVRAKLEFETIKDQIKESLSSEKRRATLSNTLEALKKNYRIKKDLSKI